MRYLVDPGPVQQEQTHHDQVVVEHGLMQGSHDGQVDMRLKLCVCFFANIWFPVLTWWRAVMPAMLILLTSMSTLALRNIAMMASPSASLMLSSKTTSSGKRTLRTPGCCRAKKEARRDIFCQVDQRITESHVVLLLSCQFSPIMSMSLQTRYC